MKQNTNQIFKAEDLDWKELEKNGNICNDDPDENVYSRHAKQVMPVFKAMDGEKNWKATGTWNCSCKVKQQKPCH